MTQPEKKIKTCNLNLLEKYCVFWGIWHSNQDTSLIFQDTSPANQDTPGDSVLSQRDIAVESQGELVVHVRLLKPGEMERKNLSIKVKCAH